MFHVFVFVSGFLESVFNECKGSQKLSRYIYTDPPIESPPPNHLVWSSCIGQGCLLLFRPQAGKHINQALWETIASDRLDDGTFATEVWSGFLHEIVAFDT